jgi:hypothetical protein
MGTLQKNLRSPTAKMCPAVSLAVLNWDSQVPPNLVHLMAWVVQRQERISRSLWILMFPLTDYLLLILFVSTLQNLTDANACEHSTYLKIQQDLLAQTNKLPPMNLKTKRHLEPQSISPKLCSTQRFPACNFAGMGFVSSWSCRHTWPWA